MELYQKLDFRPMTQAERLENLRELLKKGGKPSKSQRRLKQTFENQSMVQVEQ